MKSKGRPLIAALAFASVVAFTQSPALKAELQTRRLVGHLLPASITAGARPFTPPDDRIRLAIRLPMQHVAELDEFLSRVYDPRDALYGHYLSPARFAARFGAKEADIRAVRRYLAGLGCALGELHPERLTVDAVCAQGAIEQAFSVQISHWLTADNQLIRTIDQEPRVPAGLPIAAIHGLTSSPRRPYFVRFEPEPGALPAAGSGPGGGLSPSDIKAAYGLGPVTQSGAGQTLAVFELDGYNASDISTYASQFGIKAAPLQNVLIDGTAGTAGSGAPEVCLDIELMMAVAPGATRIVVYEAPNTDAGVIDLYQRIANDDSARQISTSWGATELGVAAATRNSENQIFKQMAAQGQSLYAASGDSGALDNGSSLSVDDPASQPYVTGAGGTTLTTQADHTYLKETAWWDATRRIGGGGGISSVWPIPSWQVGAAAGAAGASSTQRNVPDVALDADELCGTAVGRLHVAGQSEARKRRRQPAGPGGRGDLSAGARSGLPERLARHQRRQHQRALSGRHGL
jgi:kumamolisin